MATKAVVVGTDGTASSTAAVVWAAREARRRRVPLRIVHAFEWDWQTARFTADTGYVATARGIAQVVAATARERAAEVAPDVSVETDTVVGRAVPQLLEAAEDAELLVVGSRGRGGFAGLLLGSVSQRVATHASCPVVVVRGPAAPDGPIAVGVDDSPVADLVLAAAFDHGGPLIAVRAYLPAFPLWLSDAAPPSLETPRQDAEERERLEELLAPWRAKYPDVPVETVVTHESAAYALERSSRRARLVIVGSRGHGLVAGTLIGSTTLQLLHHAACPVLVTRR